MSDPHGTEKASAESFSKRFSNFTSTHKKRLLLWIAAAWFGLVGLSILLGRVLHETPERDPSGILNILNLAVNFGSVVILLVFLCLSLALGVFRPAENKLAEDVKSETSPIAKYWYLDSKEIRALGSEIYENIIVPLLFLVLGLAVLGLIVGAVILLFSSAPWWAALVILLLIVLILK